MKKIAAHDRWVCFECRWSAKFPLLDVRVPARPSYICPKCNKLMLWSGTAFRPPRRDDDEAWRVARAVMAAGARYHTTSRRRRFPRTMVELQSWLTEQEEGEVWHTERSPSVGKRIDGQLRIRVDRQVLADEDPVLIFHDGGWHEGRVKLLGDGRKPLSTAFVTLSSSRRSIPLVSGTRLRTRR